MNVAVHISPEVAEAWPDYRAVVVVAEGVRNGPSDADSEALLAEAERAARESGLGRAADDPRIAAWRAVFSQFGSKPSRYPSSAESLLARVLKGEGLPRINALVDTYNAISVKYVIPVGGEDLDRSVGDLRLVREPDGEVVWRDDEGITCRRWNWRQEPRTRLTEATTNAFFVFDQLPPQQALDAAVEELSGAVGAEAGASASSRRHPDGAVEADHLAVEHRVLGDVAGERGVLRRPAQARRERDLGAEGLA
jgi:DNA/RNA-binding domain of Phe-tRNA-synthetase-like protein